MDKRELAILNELDETGRVLDVGCIRHNLEQAKEYGFLHGEIQRKCDDAIGIDLKSGEVDKLKRKTGWDIRVMDAEKIDFNCKFDFIVAGDVLEHLSNPGMFFKKAYTLLEQNGKLIITTPNTFALKRFLEFLKNKTVNVNKEHTVWFDENVLIQLSKRYGFKHDKTRYIVPGDRGIGGMILPLHLQASTLFIVLYRPRD